jgi:hypothetical protein
MLGEIAMNDPAFFEVRKCNDILGIITQKI